MEEWSDSVKLAVDVLIACIIVSALLVVKLVSSRIMAEVDKEHATAADVAEYRVQRMYDGSDCYAQDIVSLVLEYQGEPAVVVHPKTGTAMEWSSRTYYTALTSAAISASLVQNSVYACTLVYDANGSLVRYDFVEK